MAADADLVDAVALEMGRDVDSLTDVQLRQINMWLDDVVDEIAVRLPDADRSHPVYRRVVRQAVARRASMPDFGLTSRSVGVDDARVEFRYESRTASLMLPQWWDELGWSGSDGGAFTIVPCGPRWPL